MYKSPIIYIIFLVSLPWYACDEADVSLDEMSGGSGNMVVTGEETAQPICGDGICYPSETVNTCPQDCSYCGDGQCLSEEDEQNCPTDCSIEMPRMNVDQDMRPSADQELEMTLDSGVMGEDLAVSNLCGDSVCDEEEQAAICPVDCAANDVQPDPNEMVIGYVDNVELRQGQWMVRGWACHGGWAPSIAVEVYAGGDSTTGTFLKREIAQETQEEAVGQACGVDEGQHRFSIPFTEQEVIDFAGEAIFVQAISPVNQERHALNNSGEYRLPSMGSSEALPDDLNAVTWLHTDVSSWPVTTSLSVSFSNGSICLEYDKKNVWPSVEIDHSSGNGTVDVVANPWVFLEYQGQWYAGTWEWLAVGVTCRNRASVAGDHIKQAAHVPLDWRPRSGERLYFMVSALARISQIANVQERSQIVEIIWP